MATTVHNFPSDGTLVARGLATVSNGQTVSTGLTQVGGFIATCATADAVIAATSISGGTVTVNVHVAGSPSADQRTIYWKAWTSQKI